MDAPLEAMVYPVTVTLLFFCAWVLVFPVLLWSFSRFPLSKRRLSLLKSFLLHLVSLPVLFVWGLVVIPVFFKPDTIFSIGLGLVVFVPISLYCPPILSWLLKTRLLAGLTLGTAGSLFAAVTFLAITWIWPFPRLHPIVRAPDDMWHLSTDLFDFVQLTKATEGEGRFPIPEDGEGHRISGSLPESVSVTAETYTPDSGLIYYRGPSFVPEELTTLSPYCTIPPDPFDEKEERPYGYAVGPLNPEKGGVFILSCYGPDGISQAEHLETLLFQKHNGNTGAFKNDLEVLNRIYSPSNGTGSAGDLIRVEPGW